MKHGTAGCLRTRIGHPRRQGSVLAARLRGGLDRADRGGRGNRQVEHLSRLRFEARPVHRLASQLRRRSPGSRPRASDGTGRARSDRRLHERPACNHSFRAVLHRRSRKPAHQRFVRIFGRGSRRRIHCPELLGRTARRASQRHSRPFSSGRRRRNRAAGADCAGLARLRAHARTARQGAGGEQPRRRARPPRGKRIRGSGPGVRGFRLRPFTGRVSRRSLCGRGRRRPAGRL